MRRWIGVFQLVPFLDDGLDKLYSNLFNSVPIRPLLAHFGRYQIYSLLIASINSGP